MPAQASPYSFRFYSDILPLPETAGYYLRLEPRTAIRLTVPVTWPLDDFKARFLEIASKPRLRWATAGYGFAGAEGGSGAQGSVVGAIVMKVGRAGGSWWTRSS